MNRRRNRLAPALAALAAAFHAYSLSQLGAATKTPGTPPGAVVAIESVALVDVVRGEIVTPRTVLIIDGKIAAVEEPDGASIPPAAVRVDGRGRFLMPGLVDMHVHLFNNATRRAPNDWTFPLFIANGVTAVREMAASPSDLPVLKRWGAAVAHGDLIAPHVLAKGGVVRQSSIELTRQQVREAHAAGADFVKIFSDVPEQ